MSNQNTVELIGFYGDDLTHACSAWTSTSREITPDKKERVGHLLKMLAENGHHTPFEKSSLHFLIKTDIASHIHLIKHRVGVSVNGESARYKEIKEDNFLLPEDWPAEWRDIMKAYTERGLDLYHKCVEDLVKNHGFDRKRAKESARFFRPYNTQITSDVMFNMRSFTHFIKLRYDKHAQKEIKDIAKEMLYLVRNIEGNPFELSLNALLPLSDYP